MQTNNLVWFMGIVEDVNDPKKLGRLKVRMINEYSNRVDTNDIPWASVMTPINSASFVGVGISPTGITTGSRVIGIFIDGESKTKPLVIGTMPIILNGEETEHSVSQQARGQGPVKKEYLEYEPKTAYAAEYPNNDTISTKSGHLIEIDDTPKAERIHVYHKSGSYVEMNADGSMIVKSAEKSIEIATENKELYSDKGDIKLETKTKNIELKSKKDINASGDKLDIDMKSDIAVKGKTIKINSDGSVQIEGSSVTIKSPSIKLEGNVTINGRRPQLQ